MPIDTKTYFYKLKSEFTFVLRKYLFLPNRDRWFYDTKKLKTFLIKNKEKQEVIALKPEYSENPVEASNKYEISDYKEDDNLKLVHATISLLIDMQNKQLDKEDLLNAYDKVIVALDCLAKSINSEQHIITEKIAWTSDVYNDLKQELYGIVPESSDNDNVKKDFQNRIVEIVCSPSFRMMDFLYILHRILSTITEEKSTNEKIKSYIDDVFIFLLLILFRQRTMESGVSLAELITTIEKNVIIKLVESEESKKSSFEIQEYKNLKDKSNDSLVAYLWRRDIHFWFKIINLIRRQEYKSWNISDDIPAYLTEELRQYRNMAAHSSGNALDAKWLTRTLRAINLFAKNIKEHDPQWEFIAAFLDERYTFEMHNENITNHQNVTTVKYGEIMYYDLECGANPIKSWKSVLKFRTSNYYVPTRDEENPQNIRRRARALPKYFFDEMNEEEQKEKLLVVKQIQNYYKEYRFLFPPFINQVDFQNMIEEGYPFSPAFYIMTQGMNFGSVLMMAQDCIKKALSSEEMHPLIMPCDINFLRRYELREKILSFYSTGKTIGMAFYRMQSSRYFLSLEEYFLKKKTDFDAEFEPPLNSYSYSSVWKSVVLLSINKIAGPKKKVEPSLEMIRLCSCQPGESIEDIETSIDVIRDNNLYALPNNPLQLINPMDYKDEIDKVLNIENSETNIFTIDENQQNKYAKDFAKEFTESYKSDYVEQNVKPDISDILQRFDHELIENIFNEQQENPEYKEVLNRLSPKEVDFFRNAIKKFSLTNTKLTSMHLPYLSGKELDYFSKLYGECAAEELKKELSLQNKILHYTKIIWHYHNQINSV